MTRDFLLTTLFSAGDVVPFVRIGTQLRARGHRVTLATHAPFRGLVEEAGLAFATWDTPAQHAAMMADGALFDDLAGFAQIYERHVLPNVEREAETLRAHCTPSTVLVTRCGPALAARAVAEQTSATLVEAYLGPGHASPIDVVQELARPWRATIATLRGRDDDPDAWIASCHGRFGLWPEWFAPAEPHWPPELQLVGFAPAPAVPAVPADLEPLLASPRPLVLLACGTGHFLTSAVVGACADAVAALGGTLLVVTPFADLIPSPLPPSTHWLTSAPYGSVFSRVDVVLHHGGIGTVTDALRAGVPQIALGAGGDRPVNARCVERLGVGRYVPPAAWSETAIGNALRELLASMPAREACATAAAATTHDAGDVCRTLESVSSERVIGAATRAPAPSVGGRVGALSPAQRELLAKRMRQRGGGAA